LGKKKDIPHLFVTNTTSRPRTDLVTKLADFGIDTDESHILTPSVAAAQWLQSNHISTDIALFVPDATRQEFKQFHLLEETSDQTPSAVVVGDLGDKWNFAILNRAFRYLMSQPSPEFIALGMTRYWQADDGLRLDVAPFIVALEYASGVKSVVLGKPAKAFFLSALSYLNVEASQTVMIGDDIHSDIQGAQQAGLQAVQVKTGKFREADLEKGITPDGIIDSINDFPQWWDGYLNKL